MQDNDVKKFLDASVSRERPRDLLIEMVRVPSPQTALLEEEPLLKEFIRKAIEPRLRAMGFADVYYNAMGNLIASYGAGTNGKSLLFIGNVMNQPPATMPNSYAGNVIDGAPFGLPGEWVLGKGTPCHSSRPWDGANAVTRAIAACCRAKTATRAPTTTWHRSRAPPTPRASTPS